jgi:hypothetical protein
MLRNKTILKMITVLSIMSTSFTTVFANNLVLQVDNEAVVTNNTLILEDEVYLIEVNDIAKLLNVGIEIDGDKVMFTNYDTEITIFTNDINAIVNGKSIAMPSKPVLRSDGIYVPLTFISEELDSWVLFNGNVINIESNKINYHVLNNHDTEDKVKVYTFESAVKKSINKNNSINRIADQLLIMEKQRSKMMLNKSTINDSSAFIDVTRSLASMDVNMINQKNQQRIIKEGSEFAVSNISNSIARRQNDVQFWEAKVYLFEKRLANAELEHSLGNISETDLLIKKKELEEWYMELGFARKDVEREKTNLKVLLGISSKENMKVEYTPKLDMRPIENIDNFIVAKIKESPILESKRRELQVAEFKLETRLVGEMTIELEKNINDIVRDIANERDNITKSITSNYIELQKLEYRKKFQEADLAFAYSNYNNAKSNYRENPEQFGSMDRLDDAKVLILDIKKNLENNKYEQALLRLRLNTPYL